jgi:O-antigen ligase
MAHEALTTPLARPRPAFGFMDAAFLALLLLAFVGLEPFAIRNPATDLQTGPYQMTGGGDSIRQILYLLVFGAAVTAAFLSRGFAMVKIAPPMLSVLLAWCLLSAVWAAAPDVAVRRAGLAIVVALSTMLCVDTLGVERSLRLWRFVLGAVLIVNCVSILLVHQAVHLPGEQDPGLVGDWRGLYFHKNIAGAVSAITAIVFFFSAFRSKRWIDIAFCLLAVGFTVMTRSKSSLGLLPLAMLAGLVYRMAWRSRMDRAIVAVAGLLVFFLIAAFLVVDADAISRALQDPAEFTGRAAIWQA